MIGLLKLLKKAPLAGAFFVAAFWLPSAQAFCPAPPGLAAAQVREVVDGDTLRLQDGRSVRLIGINAPEIGRKGRSDEPFAVIARRRLQALVDASDGMVGLQLGAEPRDRYQRTLAHVYGRNEQSFEAQLLAEGLAWQVVVAPNNQLSGCQHQAEQAARQAGLGVWRASSLLPAANIQQSGFAMLRGRVSDVTRNRGGIWVELDDTLVLHIPTKLQPAFDWAQLKSLKGQQVEARGWVIDRSRRSGLQPGQPRWMLPISDPLMLQRVK